MKYNFSALMASSVFMLAPCFASANDYGIPTSIQESNILHCFDWKIPDITRELPNIAEAGFGAIQISPIQSVAQSAYNWSDVYRPYDYAVRSCGIGNASQLAHLCEEAEKYGIKIIVDVVLNHLDNAGSHSSWWDKNERIRPTTASVNYGNRYSITHDRIGAYPEVNTEDPEVIERARGFMEELKGYGVKGIRFDAAKHIGLPSEGSDFWKVVTSVDGLYYYGEILDNTGGSNPNELLREYASYMCVTDNAYGEGARRNSGNPVNSANWGLSVIGEDRCVYWSESHDTFANAGGSTKNTSQGSVDRGYAIIACRNLPTALYFSRPAYTAFGDIKVGQKGSTHFMDPEVAEVNKFRNAMVGRPDSYTHGNGCASVTREDGGAVVVKVGGGNVDVDNGNGYCPVGTYIDRVSGNEFTVTESSIKGTVGPTGIAVIYSHDLDAAVDDIPADLPSGPIEWFTLQGLKVSSPSSPGIYIRREANGKTKKIFIR